ncbi:MAG: hypothetical protein ACRDK9_10475 [Solirubrobacterales bacterium]
MSVAESIAELRAQAGKQFDPNVVDAVIGIVDEWDALPAGLGPNGAAPNTHQPALPPH